MRTELTTYQKKALKIATSALYTTLLLLIGFTVGTTKNYLNKSLNNEELEKKDISTRELITKNEYKSATYFHMATNLNFNFEYPESWHVRIYFSPTENPNEYLDKIELNPKPLRQTDKMKVIQGSEVTENVYLNIDKWEYITKKNSWKTN